MNQSYELTTALSDDGVALLDVSDRSHEWVSRRIEQVSFEDDLTLCRRTTLDLNLSPEFLDEIPTWRGRILLPVKLLDRGASSDATITDSTGLPLPQLTRRHERALVAAGIAETYVGALTDPVDRYGKILANIDPDLFPGSTDHESNDQAFLDLLERFSNARLLIAAVDLDVDDGSGALLRLHVVQSENIELPRAPDEVTGIKRRTEPRLDDVVYSFEVGQVDGCESFHIELVAPEGVWIREGRLAVRRAVTDEDEQNAVLAEVEALQAAQAPREEELAALAKLAPLSEHPDDDPHSDRVHAYYARPTDDSTAFLGASMLAVLRPQGPGTLRPGWYVSCATTLVLIALWLTIGWAGAPSCVPRPMEVDYSVQREAVVASILLGPALVAGLLANADEHLLTKQFVFWHRRRIALQASTCFAAASLYAVGVPTGPRWWLMMILAVVSSFLTVRTGRSYAASSPKVLRSHA